MVTPEYIAEMEYGIIGAMLRQPDGIGEAVSKMHADDFSLPETRSNYGSSFSGTPLIHQEYPTTSYDDMSFNMPWTMSPCKAILAAIWVLLAFLRLPPCPL